jgi:DNA-binding transcriptional ArsR family regulator
MSTAKSSSKISVESRDISGGGERGELSPQRAGDLARLFKVFSNENRLRLLDRLAADEEVCVQDLAAALEMTTQAVSNQLQRLADQRLVIARREGTRAYYRIADPCIAPILDLGKCFVAPIPPFDS